MAIDRYIKVLILLFLSLLVLLLLTSIALFAMKIGVEPQDIVRYYIGDEESFIAKKSFEGLLETTVPHLFAVTTTIFILIHLLLFTKYKKYSTPLFLGLSISFILDLTSGYFLMMNLSLFALVKFISFLLFEMLFFVTVFLLIKELISHKFI